MDKPVDTSFDRESIAIPGSVGEARPVLLGLRSAITARRVERSQRKIERYARAQQVASLVGRVVIQGAITDEGIASVSPDYRQQLEKIKGKGYGHRDNPLRPTSRRELRTTKALSQAGRQHRLKNSAAMGIASASPEVLNKYETQTAPIFESSKHLTLVERLHLGKQARILRKTKRKLTKFDTNFQKALTAPSRGADREIQKRNRLVVHQQALQNARNRHRSRRAT